MNKRSQNSKTHSNTGKKKKGYIRKQVKKYSIQIFKVLFKILEFLSVVMTILNGLKDFFSK